MLGDGRVTIDLDHDEAVEPFLNLNPKLRETLEIATKKRLQLLGANQGRLSNVL